MLRRLRPCGLYLALAAACTLAGCQALPLPPAQPPSGAALAVPGGPAVRLQGPAGPLGAAQSQRLLDGLRQPAQATDIFAHHLAVEVLIATSPLTTGNAVQLLQDGPATYAAMLKAIAGARDHINLETYILDDDAVGQRFAQALIDKQAQGVQVNLIRDSVGTLGTPAAYFERLQASGVQVLEFNPINPLSAGAGDKGWSPNQRDHRKLLIVDGQTAFLGGINLSEVYSGGSRSLRRPRPLATQPPPEGRLAWRDTDLQLQGPVVGELQKLFLASWLKQSGAPALPRNYFPKPVAAGHQVVRAVGSSPDDAFSQIYATLLSAIHSAQTSVHVTMAYFAPDPQLLAALQAAAGRGVDVTLILPGQSDSWLVLHAGRASYQALLRAGVKIFDRRGVVLHAKTALIDGVWSTVGSTNLDWRSFLHNQELNAVVLGADFGGQVQRMFERDLAASDPVLLARWQHRPWGWRLQEWFARVWEYWL